MPFTCPSASHWSPTGGSSWPAKDRPALWPLPARSKIRVEAVSPDSPGGAWQPTSEERVGDHAYIGTWLAHLFWRDRWLRGTRVVGRPRRDGIPAHRLFAGDAGLGTARASGHRGGCDERVLDELERRHGHEGSDGGGHAPRRRLQTEHSLWHRGGREECLLDRHQQRPGRRRDEGAGRGWRAAHRRDG